MKTLIIIKTTSRRSSGKNQVEKYLFSIPSKAPKGRYKLMFKLVDQANEKKQKIQLGLEEKSIGSHGFIYLGKVSV